MKDINRPFENKEEELPLSSSTETKPVIIDNSDTQSQIFLELPNGIKLNLVSKTYEVDALSNLSLNLIDELIQRLNKKNGSSYTG